MITGIHTMFYSSDADATRTFLRDVLGLKMGDSGGGWLIARAPAAELGCHPAMEEKGAPVGTHSVSFTTDDLDGAIAELKAKGVECTDVNDWGYGRTTHFVMPGGVKAELYQPSYTLEFK